MTGSPQLARAAIAGGVDRILVDLERLGKAERQKGRSLFISAHGWEDVAAVRAATPTGRLVVRLDPVHAGTPDQVERAVGLGADALMLPYFHSAAEALRFCDVVNGRASVIPLVETKSAADDLDGLLTAGAIGEFHVGLNDLAIDVSEASHHSLWSSELVANVSATARRLGIRFGLGGVTDPRSPGLAVDPRWIIEKQRELGSDGALLGRSFRACFESDPDVDAIAESVGAIQNAFGKWPAADATTRA